ncbi:hypothetical protein LIER_25831 [Lithospermum erythrorhizon]|uniref:ATP-dependent DNA helicase n=1 Tax=Lithospermum erythrorhizon TaxID=34254 RepID=A0AAV3R9H7_LITER
MPHALHMLFATLLYYCKPSKPNDLFSKFYNSMADDIMHKVLMGINDTLKSLGKEINDYHIRPSEIADEGDAYFFDGPEGTGKSHLYKVLLAHIRSRGFIALVVATSGIVLSCFIGGRIAHSKFKIPIDVSSGVKCQVSVSER